MKALVDRRSCVLVVDDEPRNRSLVRGFLSPHFDLLEAASGADALELLRETPVDLVLLDVMMPEQDGFETCKLIKAEPRDKFLPVILLTALGEQEDRNRGLEAGADDFLRKPVDRRELLLRVKNFLRLRDQERIIRAQVDELRRLQSMKDDMVSLLVHDLRNPLAGLLCTLELALDTPASPQQEADLKTALGCGEVLRQALDETLQVRLLEEDAVVARRVPVDLAALIRTALGTLEPVARRRKVDLRWELEGEAEAPLDGRLVQRSIENLLSNALKYTPKGSDVLVLVRTQGGAVVLEVADRGPGVPDELKGVLFERFGSLEAHRGSERRGVGLGLYLVKLVAQAHGGGVSVHDRPGGGAIFRLNLAPPPRPQEDAA
jgi:signal transduction histidine kinase